MLQEGIKGRGEPSSEKGGVFAVFNREVTFKRSW